MGRHEKREDMAMIHDIELREESAEVREERQYHAFTKDEFQRRLDDLQRDSETNLGGHALISLFRK